MDTYNKTCLVEPSVAPNLKHETFVLMDIYRGTEKFCYDVMRAWQKQTTLTSQQNCSDCLLGTLQLDQSSGFSHSGEFEKEFSFLTSSCGNKRFAPSTAMPIALNPSQKSSTVLASASTSATAGPCMEMYTIQEDDTCNGICKAENVSTYSLMSYNRLKAYCKDLPPAGTKLCMPPSCDIYTVQGKDTCRSIAAAQPGYVTITQIQAWNPNLNALCTNMKQQEGMQICVSPPGQSFNNSNATGTASTPAPLATTEAPRPSSLANGTITHCAKYYVAKKGDTCDKITREQPLSLKSSDLKFLNTGLDANCSNIIPGDSYCVEAVGDISTYSGYGIAITGDCTGAGSPSTCYGDWATLSPVPFGGYGDLNDSSTTRPRSSSRTNSKSTTTQPKFTAMPRASGTLSSSKCDRYIEHVNAGSNEINKLVNSCSSIANFYGINVDDFVKWNPSLDRDDCELSRGYSYCVSLKNAVETPTPTQSGIDSNCTNFYKVVKDNGCYAIATDHGITPAEFHEYNPAVKKDCSGLWPDYYVCVGVTDGA
ncbi:hypothetical protein VI817_006148 [Penicillium citrinum]|nr:hypothetical protein VI817_006148 [Penicillium citrinum]